MSLDVSERPFRIVPRRHGRVGQRDLVSDLETKASEKKSCPMRKENYSEGASRLLGGYRLRYDDVQVTQEEMSHSRGDVVVVEVVVEV